MIRPSGFSQSQAMARQFAKCRLCPRGFEGPVVLLWQETPCCQSCFIRMLDEWNARMERMRKEIHGQQGSTKESGAKYTPDELIKVEYESPDADTSQETDGLDKKYTPSRPGIHGLGASGTQVQPPNKQVQTSCNPGEDKAVRFGKDALDTQSQDWLNRKAGEVKSPLTLRGPDIDDGKVGR